MAITLAQMCDAIAADVATVTVGAVTLLTQSYDELTEGMQNCPVAQVYPESIATDVSSDATDMTTLRGAVRQSNVGIRVDVYVAQRNQLDENMEAVTLWMDALWTRLWTNTTGSCALFGLRAAGLKNLNWTAQRVVFTCATQEYAGIRFDLTCRIF